MKCDGFVFRELVAPESKQENQIVGRPQEGNNRDINGALIDAG